MNETIIAKALFLVEMYKAISQGKLLQTYNINDKQWHDYDGNGAGPNLLSNPDSWRVKPREPERMWRAIVDGVPDETNDESKAQSWTDSGLKVTEWLEVIK